MRTKEEKAEFYKVLRQMWKTAKEMSFQEGNTVQAIIENHGLEVSVTSYIMVLNQMKEKNLDGIPYIDMKTFNGWKENGFKVKKGEKSKAYGVAWKVVESKEDEEDDRVFPKVYHLFHRSQVEEI